MPLGWLTVGGDVVAMDQAKVFVGKKSKTA